jgi:hypothetical protein
MGVILRDPRQDALVDRDVKETLDLRRVQVHALSHITGPEAARMSALALQ